MQRLEGPRTTAGISKGRGRAGAARKLIGMEWAQEGKGELQKLKAEGLPCSRPCPDLGWLPLTRSPGRGWDRRQAAQTERSQQRPTLPQGPCLTETRVEGINTPEHFLCARLCAWPGIIQVACAKCSPCARHWAGLFSVQGPQNDTWRQHCNIPGSTHDQSNV